MMFSLKPQYKIYVCPTCGKDMHGETPHGKTIKKAYHEASFECRICDKIVETNLFYWVEIVGK